MSNTPLYNARNQIKAHLNAYEPLQNVAVFVERQGVDIDDDVEDAIDSKGIAIVILASAAGVADQISQGGVTMRVTVPVCVLENPKVNMAEGGHNLPSEDMIQLIISALLGKTAGHGTVTVSQEVFARAGDDSGLIEHYIGFDVPLIVRGS